MEIIKFKRPYKLVKPWRFVIILFLVLGLLALLILALQNSRSKQNTQAAQEISQSSDTSNAPPETQDLPTADIDSIKNQMVGYMAGMILANPGNYPASPSLEPVESYIVEPEPEPEPALYRLVIDPGHGGNDGGCDTGKVRESVVNLEIALKLRDILREQVPEIEVVMTRETDTYVGLDTRARLANEIQADFFLSIHCNSYEGDSSVNGLETKYWLPSTAEKQTLGPKSKEAAQVLLEKASEGFGLRKRHASEQSLQVLRTCEMPCVLMELGYLSNEGDDEALRNPEIQERGAQAMADAIVEILYGYEPRNAQNSGEDSEESSMES